MQNNFNKTLGQLVNKKPLTYFYFHLFLYAIKILNRFFLTYLAF